MSLSIVFICLALVVGIYFYNNPLKHGPWFLSRRVDLVLTGHEHLYQRTQPLAFGEGCPSIRPGRFDPACVTAEGGTTSSRSARAAHPCVTCTHRTQERPTSRR